MAAVIILREYDEWTPLQEIIDEADQSDFLAAWGEENDRLTSELGLSHDALATKISRSYPAIRAQGIAGTVRIANYVVQIVPKCLSTHTIHWERSLLRMLSFSQSLQFELSAPVEVDAELTDIVDHIAYAFAIELETALHSGPLLIYQEREVFSPYARGRVLFEPIADLITRPQQLHCLIEEMDAQNPYTSLFCW